LQGVVTEDQPLLARRGPPVVSARDLGVRTADADGQGLDDNRHELDAGLGDIAELRRAHLPGNTVTAGMSISFQASA
jgi:hypothetical protein